MPRRPALSFPFGPWVASTARVAWIVGWLGLLRALPAESPPTNSLPLQMALEEGAWREEVSGHYNGAIRIHEQLLERPALPDRIRVEALHRLGIATR
jgi:hypothetical protein